MLLTGLPAIWRSGALLTEILARSGPTLAGIFGRSPHSPGPRTRADEWAIVGKLSLRFGKGVRYVNGKTDLKDRLMSGRASSEREIVASGGLASPKNILQCKITLV